MKFIAILAAYYALGALEVRPAWRRGHRAEAAAAAVISGLGALYATGAVAGWPVLNPVRWVTAVFRPMAAFFGAL